MYLRGDRLWANWRAEPVSPMRPSVCGAVSVCQDRLDVSVGQGHRAEREGGGVPQPDERLAVHRAVYSHPTVRCGCHGAAVAGPSARRRLRTPALWGSVGVVERERTRRTPHGPMSADIAWRRGRAAARRAAVGRGRRGGLSPGHAHPRPRQSGGRRPGGGCRGPLGKPRSGPAVGSRGPLGRPPRGSVRCGPWGGPLVQAARETESGGASPRSPGELGRVPGVAGPSPPPSPDSGAAGPARIRIRRVTTRKSGLGAEPLMFFPTSAWNSGRPAPCPPPAGWDSGSLVSVPIPALGVFWPRVLVPVTLRRRVVQVSASPAGLRGSSLWQAEPKPLESEREGTIAFFPFSL